MYAEACDFRTYRLTNKNGRYHRMDRRNLRHMRKDIDVQMKSRTFDGSKPVTILTFLKEFQDSCNTNGIHEGAARWLIRKYLHGAAQTLFDTTESGRKNSRKRLDTYCDVVHFLLRSYAKNEVIAKAHQEITSLRQDRTHATEEDYAQALLLKANACGSVYPEKKLLGYFVEGCIPQVRSSVRTHLAAHPDIDLMELATYARTIGDIVRSTRDNDNKNKDQDKKEKEKKPKHAGQVATVDSDKKSRRGRRSRNSQKQAASTDGSTSTATAPSPAAAVFAVQSAGRPDSPSSSSRTGYTTYAPSNPASRYARSPSPGRSAPTPCRICLAFDHREHECPLLTPDQAIAVSKVREENYQHLRSTGYYDRSRSRERAQSPGDHRSHSYSTKSVTPSHPREQTKNE